MKKIIIKKTISLAIILCSLTIPVTEIDGTEKVPEPPITQAAPVAEEIKQEAPYYILSQEERRLVEATVMQEAGGEPYEGQLTVAQSICDRAVFWGMSITEVLTAPKQYTRCNKQVTDSVKQAVAAVFDQGETIYPRPTTHFHDDSISPPAYTDKKVRRGQIGRLIFYGNENL